MSLLTAEYIDRCRSARGGWTKAQLAEWGVPWPPPKGWRRALIHGEPIALDSRPPLTEEQEARVREIITEMTGAV